MAFWEADMRSDSPTLQQLADYTSRIADDAQVRLIEHAFDASKPIYDDSWWQPVMDYVRFHLAELAAADTIAKE